MVGIKQYNHYEEELNIQNIDRDRIMHVVLMQEYRFRREIE